MLQGLYSAAAGMAAQQQRIDGVSNDLANVNTTGYKQVRVGFRDLLYNAQGDQAGAEVRAGAGARADFIGRSQAQGVLKQTEQPLDLAIQGQGFFQVRRADGTVALTRDGNFRLDAQRRLTTQDGALVTPPIALPADATLDDISFGSDGAVRVGDRQVGQLRLVRVANPDGLRATGDNRFVVTEASGPAVAADARITQGALEGSNVDMGNAMVEMMTAQRSFQLASKAIEMQDQMMEIANQVKR
jgi:flagellar basal-body rod protein FlgG